MKSWLESHKPRATYRHQLLLAGLMWSLVGFFLFMYGSRWAFSEGKNWGSFALILAGILLGVAKARFILDPVAQRVTDRILKRGDGRCVGGFLSLRSWTLVAAMILFGRLLRCCLFTTALAGMVYITVGTGLMLSSRLAWKGWRKSLH